MRCLYCGRVNKPERTICKFCGAPLDYIEEMEEQAEDVLENLPEYTPDRFPEEVPYHVQDYLVQAILTTLCCCIPFGIVAIVYASRVKSFLRRGEYAMDKEASKKAKMWCWIGGISGFVFYIINYLISY